ncbi:MAG: metalloregulator ArsR/SmtB family transcription factor [Pseudomonadota bacterium]
MTNQLDSFFGAMADPTRRAVIERLASGPASVSELHKPHDMALPTFMRHLKVLEDTGIVRSIKKGRVRTCHIEAGPLIEAQGWLAWQREIWESRLDRLETLAHQISRDSEGETNDT